MERILRTARRVAVLGAKPDSRIEAAGHWIPKLLQELGYQVTPVPVRYPDVTKILGVPVVRRLQEIAQPMNILSVFLRSAAVPALPAAFPKLRPPVVWFQSGLIDIPCAKAMIATGIVVAHDCIACRRATLEPVTAPLEGQS